MRKTEVRIFLFSIIIQILCIVLFVNGKLLLLVGVLSLIIFFALTAFSVEKIFLLLAFYVSGFPMIEYIGNFPGLPFGFAWYIAYPLFVLLIAYWLIYLSKTQEKFLLNQMDAAVAMYLAVMLFATVHGFAKGYELKILLWDFMPTAFFLGYFILLYSPLKNKIRKFYDILLVTAIFVSIQFIYALVNYRSLLVLSRIVSVHIHIAQFAIPYIIATLIYSTSRKRKLLFAIFLPLIILGIIICQQRALYVSTFSTIIFLAGIFLYTRREWIRKSVGRFVIYLAVGFSIIIISGIVLQIVTKGKFFLTLYARIFIFLNLNRLNADTSWIIRWGEIKSALKGLEHFWLFGKGFGVSRITRFRYVKQIVLDNAYAYLLWKTGIVGLLSFLYMHFVFLRRGIATLRKKLTPDERIFIITAIANTIGLMLIGVTNCSISHYRLMFVWAALFSCTEIIVRKYD